MFPRLLVNLGALLLIVFSLFVLTRLPSEEYRAPAENITSSTATAAAGTPVTVRTVVATSSAATSTIAKRVATSTNAVKAKPVAAANGKSEKKTAVEGEIGRIQDPYPFPPASFEAVNIAARASLVNILCTPRSGGTLRPISASGVIVDPRGVILTNAHVAQYVLLSQDPRVDISCTVRMGAPAEARYVPEVLYIPPVWVRAHAKEIKEEKALGTGEHDYALLRIARSLVGSPIPAPPAGGFPYLPLDTRPGIGFPGDPVLSASYPAEFLGGIAAQSALYPVSTIAPVRQLLTFTSGRPDIMSLGGVIAAQGGSSGGAVVNAWGRLIGIIVTTSEGATTGERDLRALSLSYINTDIASQSDSDLADILKGDPALEAGDFKASVGRDLTELYLPYLSR